MSSRRDTRTLSLLVVVLAVTSCMRDLEAENRAERQTNATKVTADSTNDATAPLVNEAFQFRIAPSGPGWKLLDEHDARNLNSNAVAGAMNPDQGTYGVVMVERAPGLTLEQAGAWQNRLPAFALESEREFEFQGFPAKRRMYTAEVDGRPFHYVTMVVLRQGYAYQLMSWSGRSQSLRKRLAFHEAFELLDGEIRGPSENRAPVSDACGVGWRIHDGQYESALSGLRLQLPEGWRFLVGQELERFSVDAELGAVHDSSSSFVSLVVTHAPKPTLEALANQARRSFMNGLAPIAAPLSYEVTGQRVEFRRYESPPFEYLHGVYIGDNGISSIAAWYPQALREDARGPVDALLERFVAIPDNERAVIREQLLGSPNRQRRIGSDRVFRAGELLDFGHQLRWTLPPGVWSVSSFDDALAYSPDAVLYAVEVELGVFFVLEVLETNTEDPGQILTELIAGDELVSRDTVVVDGLTLDRARSINRIRSPPVSYARAITRRGPRIIAITAWSYDDSPSGLASLESALAPLEFTSDLAQNQIVGRTYTDLHYGYSFDIPLGFDDPPKTRDLGRGQLAIGWTKGDQQIVATAMVGSSDDEEWISGFCEQIVRGIVGTTLPLGKPVRSEGLLGRYPARQLTWKVGRTELHGQIVAVGSQVYTMLYTNVSESQRAAIQASWTLLE